MLERANTYFFKVEFQNFFSFSLWLNLCISYMHNCCKLNCKGTFMLRTGSKSLHCSLPATSFVSLIPTIPTISDNIDSAYLRVVNPLNVDCLAVKHTCCVFHWLKYTTGVSFTNCRFSLQSDKRTFYYLYKCSSLPWICFSSVSCIYTMPVCPTSLGRIFLM